MKRLLLFVLLLLPFTLFAYVSPGKPAGFVSDFAGMLKPETVVSLNAELTTYASQTGHEIAVVTIPKLENETIETYAVKLFEEWGIGREKEDNGLLLLISRDDREMRIEVGYGLEGVVTDIESAHIIRDIMTPLFQAGKYDEGVVRAVDRLEEVARGEAVSTTTPAPAMRRISSQAIYLSIFLLIWLGSILARSKSWWAGGVIGGLAGWIFFSGLPIIIILILVGLIFDYIVSKTYKSHVGSGRVPPWWIGGGGRGDGFGGGGFGGFGGGMSGGGGASGRW